MPSNYERLSQLEWMIGQWVDAESMRLADWQRMLDINLTGVFLCAQAEAQQMIGQTPTDGKIINIGSVHEYQARRHYAHYTTSKGGLVMLTKSMALELAEHNIQVNQVAPGAVATQLTDTARQESFLSAVPAGRIGKTADIAAMVAFLASPDAAYVTGTSGLAPTG